MAINGQPIAIKNPEIPYDKLAVSLMISPIFRDTEVGASVVMQAMYYRVLPDGTIDRPNLPPISEQHGDVYADAASDLALATALVEIEAAIKKYVAAKGY